MKLNEIKMKAKKKRNELKVSDLETYPLKNEERRKTLTALLTETSQKRYGSTSTWIFFTETIFSPKTAEMHSQGNQGPLEQPPSAYL